MFNAASKFGNIAAGCREGDGDSIDGVVGRNSLLQG
jgi:hypothetical protein